MSLTFPWESSSRPSSAAASLIEARLALLPDRLWLADAVDHDLGLAAADLHLLDVDDVAGIGLEHLPGGVREEDHVGRPLGEPFEPGRRVGGVAGHRVVHPPVRADVAGH